MAKDDNQNHVYDDDGNDIVPPAPKRWGLYAAIGASVAAVGTVMALALLHPAPKVAIGGHHHHVTKKDPAPNILVPPNYPAPQPSGTSLFSQISQLNQRYITWADNAIHAQVPAIPATGPGAGTVTPAILNTPAVMAKFGGPKVPTSLKGIPLPVATPANGSIVGLTPQFLQQEMTVGGASGTWPGMTTADLTRAYAKAANFLFDINGNNPAGALQYMDPYAAGGAAEPSTLSNTANPNVPVTKYFTASAANGGMLPLRQVGYLSWVVITPGGIGTDTQTTTFQPSVHSPAGHVVYGNLSIANLTYDTVQSGMVHGKLTVGLYKWPIGEVDMVLIKQGGQTHWYVASFGGEGVTNTPNVVYWTAP